MHSLNLHLLSKEDVGRPLEKLCFRDVMVVILVELVENEVDVILANLAFRLELVHFQLPLERPEHHASWDAKCGGNKCSHNKYCFAEKSDAERYKKKFSVGEEVGCYFDPDAWGDIAMEFRDVGGIWIAGVVMLSLASMSFCMCTREYYVADQDARKGYVALFPKFIALGCWWLVIVVFW